jgi:hypothetical protein
VYSLYRIEPLLTDDLRRLHDFTEIPEIHDRLIAIQAIKLITITIGKFETLRGSPPHFDESDCAIGSEHTFFREWPRVAGAKPDGRAPEASAVATGHARFVPATRGTHPESGWE